MGAGIRSFVEIFGDLPRMMSGAGEMREEQPGVVLDSFHHRVTDRGFNVGVRVARETEG